ncbi:hypothetical protein [Crenobacter caeni]|uniref:DUF4398 domain-containing protein n=1 Tax=Crenobacter caeni TaxID=2705474 RepID=A0A6B2KMI2_9NEIS|nr:hypothetical protein [Crenobacter caeni]NDV11436.1 hypothetical protein [Crenobacter caeni]
MTRPLAAALFALASLPCLAGPSQDLLSAQMVYQQADSQHSASQKRLAAAQEARRMAEARVIDAQALLQKADGELAAAQGAAAASDAALKDAATRLDAAWQAKQAAN